jgi:transposase
VTTYGEALLEADRKRLNRPRPSGSTRPPSCALGTKQHTDYATTVADVENHQIIDILPDRNYTDVAGWIDKQPKAWKERIRFGALDMSATYAAVYSVILPKAAQVVDPFHVISLANRCLDAVRRRVQTEQTGHRGRRDDPALSGPAGPAHGRREARRARHRAPVVTARARRSRTPRWPSPIGSKSACATSIERDPDEARQDARRAPGHCLKRPCRPRSKARTHDPGLVRQDRNFHLARVSNGPTEALNNLIKRIKRIGFGFRNFENYRIRALLYAGKPNWRVLGSIVVR